MAKSKKRIHIDPASIRSEVVAEHSFTLLSGKTDAADRDAIARCTDPMAKAKMVSRRVAMHVANAETIMTFLKVQGGVNANGILNKPGKQLAELKRAKAEIDQAIAFFDGIVWPE